MLINMLRKAKFYGINIPLFYYYTFFYYKAKNKNKAATDKAVFLNIKKNEFGRHLYGFLKFFALEGYTIYTNRNISLFAELRREYALFLLSDGVINFGKPKSTANPVYFDDHLLSADYFAELKSDSSEHAFYFPMLQHPLMYQKGWWNEPIENKERKRSVFMAGNFDEKAYAPIENDGIFNVMTRTSVYAQLHENKKLYTIESINDLVSFLAKKEEDNKVILVNRLLVDIPMNELRNLLGKFDFFFALPGVVMPFCHNIIEAMSAGCIPFMQEGYAKLFKPALIDGRHVVTFTNADDLEKKINYLFSLSTETIEFMRKEVYEYYNNFLSPHEVVRRIETFNHLNKIYLLASQHSVSLLKKDLANHKQA